MSMCVENVTTGSPQWAKTLKRRSATGIFSTDAAVLVGERLEVFEQEVADALLVVGDRFDVDQRSCELE